MSFSRTGASLLSALTLAGGGAGVALAATSVGAIADTTPTTTAATSSTTAAATGTATVAITGPKGRTHTRTLKVRCLVRNGHLVVAAGALKPHRASAAAAAPKAKKAHHGHRAVRLIVDGTTPGTHPARLLIEHRSPTLTTLRHLRGSATVTAQGGSFSWTETLSGKKHPTLKGDTVKVAATWTCAV